jgi:hypothetical protein
MKKLYPTLLSLSLILLSLPARAEWEFTRWGMTPEELQAAGEVTPVSRREERITTDEKGTTLFKTQWQLEQFDFDVYFNFSGKPQGLNEVLLISRGDTEGIVSALTQKYGSPRSGQGNLRLQRRPGNFTLIPSNPENISTRPPQGEFTAGVLWETERDIIELNRNNPEELIIRFLPQPRNR